MPPIDITDLTLAAAAITVLIGGWRGWFVYGPQHERIVDDLKEDRDFWRRTALEALGLAEKATDVVVRRNG